MKNFTIILVALVAITGMVSCQNEELATPKPESKNKDVFVENGYLVFNDLTSALALGNKIGQMSKSERLDWEKSIGFISAKTAYEPIFSKFEMVDCDAEWANFKKTYSNKVQIIDTGESMGIDYPFSNTQITNILNEEGLIKLGSSLICFKDGYRVIKDGEYQKLDDAKRMIKSDTLKGIIVVDNGIEEKSTSTWIKDDYKFSMFGETVYSNDNKGRVTARFEWFNYLWISGNICHLDTEIYVWFRSEKKNWLGNWKYANGTCYLEMPYLEAQLDGYIAMGNEKFMVLTSNSASQSGFADEKMTCGLTTFSSYSTLPMELFIAGQGIKVRKFYAKFSGSQSGNNTEILQYTDDSVIMPTVPAWPLPSPIENRTCVFIWRN